jgi:hypothetical protein
MMKNLDIKDKYGILLVEVVYTIHTCENFRSNFGFCVRPIVKRDNFHVDQKTGGPSY